mmetsp:Transcript_36924/g.27302  ORF Transcript_36924/g.27302 Transcript_36924/m.27302 type:complete len:82 (+) Transcript_36924:188-433(+)
MPLQTSLIKSEEVKGELFDLKQVAFEGAKIIDTPMHVKKNKYLVNKYMTFEQQMKAQIELWESLNKPQGWTQAKFQLVQFA